MPDTTKQFVLPENLISPVDLMRIIRELSALDDVLYQSNLRTPGQPTKINRTSRILEEVAEANQLSLINAQHRAELISALKAFLDHAPKIHMSFAVEPSPKFTRSIIVWLRSNIHPLLLLEIGLQPTMAVGAVVRTTNKVFDMSLRHHFAENRHLLNEKIMAAGSGEPSA